jgi:hypothetical protein
MGGGYRPPFRNFIIDSTSLRRNSTSKAVTNTATQLPVQTTTAFASVVTFAVPLDTKKTVRVRAAAIPKTYLEGGVSRVRGLKRLRDHPRRLFP